MDLTIILKIMALIVGIYEVIARIFPTVNDITVIGNIIRILKAVSDALNRTR